MYEVQSPYQQFFDLDGSPLSNGYVYIGTEGLNPEVSSVAVYWDKEGTLPAAQPIRTSSGYMARNGSPSRLYISVPSYSVTIRNSRSELVATSSGSALFGSLLQHISTIAALRLLSPTITSAVVVDGYYTNGDGGEGLFTSVTGAAPGAYVDNGGTIIVPTGGDGSAAWIRQAATMTPRQFGAKADGTDASARIQAVIDAAKSTRSLSAGIDVPVKVVDLEGLSWAVSSPLVIDGSCVKVQNGRIYAIAGTWGANSSIMKIIGGTGSSAVWNVHLDTIVFDCKKLTSGVLFEGTQKCSALRCWSQYFTEFGYRAGDTGGRVNGELKLIGCSAYEYDYADPTNNTYANRTGIGFDIRTADGMMDDCVGAVCMLAAKWQSLYDWQVTNSHFWCGIYDTDRHTPLLDVAADAYDVQFNNCYFDDAVIRLYQFRVQFSGCLFIKGAGGKNTYGIEAIATTAGATGAGLIIVGGMLSNVNMIEYTTTGVGTWTDTKKIVQLGTLKEDGSSVPQWFHEYMGVTNGGAFKYCKTSTYFGVNNRAPQFQAHADEYSTGAAFSAFSATYHPVIGMARSLSATTGTFGGYPTTNTVLGRVNITGDRGADFGTPTYDATGAYAQVIATANWTAGGYPCQWEFATTEATGTGNATVRMIVTPDGHAAPKVTNTYDLGVSGSLSWRNIYSQNAVTVTSDANTKTGILDSDLGLAFIESLRPVSYLFKIGGYSHNTELVSEAVLDEKGEVTTPAVFKDVVTPLPGKRRHYGLLAQDVKASADAAGVDFGGWVQQDPSDPGSLQMLRYEELISPLIKAVQELSSEVKALKAGAR